jgi:LPXTG-motif cell wall-anchored protein
VYTPCSIPSNNATYYGATSGGTANGCDVLITFAADGGVTTTHPNPHAYDGFDDILVGIINDTRTPIDSITLTGSGNPAAFDFDGDGICKTGPSYTFAGGGSPCAHIVDPNKYGGPYVTYTAITNGENTGTVLFGHGGISPGGGTAWFSLEGPVEDADPPADATEPPTLGLVGVAIAGLGGLHLRRKKRA